MFEYEFGWVADDAALASWGAMHTLELAFVLGAPALLDPGWVMSAAEQNLTAAIQRYWSNFAAFGTRTGIRTGGPFPNGTSMPEDRLCDDDDDGRGAAPCCPPAHSWPTADGASYGTPNTTFLPIRKAGSVASSTDALELAVTRAYRLPQFHFLEEIRGYVYCRPYTVGDDPDEQKIKWACHNGGGHGASAGSPPRYRG